LIELDSTLKKRRFYSRFPKGRGSWFLENRTLNGNDFTTELGR